MKCDWSQISLKLTISSLSQYEDRLKHWGIRKYLTQDDWIAVKRLLDERRAQGKHSAVYISGKALKDSQVRKGISRPGVRNALRENTGPISLDSQLPSYLEVRSPELLPQQEWALQELTLHIPEDRSQSTKQYLVSEEQLDSLGCSLIPSRSTHMFSTFETQYIQSEEITSDNGLMREMAVSPTTDLANPESETDMLVRETIRKKILEFIPSDTISFTGIVSWNINIPELEDFQGSSQSLSRIAYIRSTKSMIPACHTSNLADMTQGASILRIAIYELVNRKFLLGDHCSKPVECMMRYLQQDRSLQSFAKLRRYLRSPSLSDALYRNLFMAALCVNAFQVMSGLLVTSTAPKSSILSSILSEQSYVKEMACVLYRGPFELVTKIFQCCDDFTKAKLKIVQKYYDSSETSIENRSEYFKIRPENAKLLCDQEFDLNWQELVGASVSSGDIYHIQSILKLTPKSEYGGLIEGNFPVFDGKTSYFSRLPVLALQKLSEKDALWVIHTLVEYLSANPSIKDQILTTGYIISMGSSRRDSSSYYLSALNVAVAREYNSVIDYLISQGAQITVTCLLEATVLKRIDLVKRFLDAGVSPFENIPLHRPGYARATTPYAEALRIGFHEALWLFDQQLLMTPGIDAQFTLLVVATEIGDRERFGWYLENLKRSYVNLNSSHYHLQQCLQDVEIVARNHGKTYILDDLFKAGVMPSHGLFENSIASRDLNRLTELFRGSNGISPPGLSRSIAKLEDRDLAEFILGCIDFQEDAYKGEFLKQAIYSNNVALVKQLLHIGINPNSFFVIKPYDFKEDRNVIQKYIGSLDSPLIVAIRCKNKHIVNMLLKHLAFLNPQLNDYPLVNSYDESEIHGYIRDNHRPRFLSALEVAVQCQDMELVYDLLSRGADPHDSNALVGLVKLGNYDILEMVLHKQRLKKYPGASNVLPALIEALGCDNSDVAHLLSHHVDLDHLSLCDIDSPVLFYRNLMTQDDQAYHFSVTMNALGRIIHGFAVQQHPLGTVRTLLQCGSNTDAICLVLSRRFQMSLGDNTRTFTPLNLAVSWDSRPLLNLLNEHGASINGSFNSLTKRTPLQLAAELGHVDMVSHLIRLGADVNSPPTPCKGFTALQLAAKNGFYRIAEVLLEHKAEVDWPAARIHGRTAFEGATENGRLDMMLLLVRSGADLISSTGSKQFERAVEFAKARGEEPAITLAHELREIVKHVTLEARDEAFAALMEKGFK